MPKFSYCKVGLQKETKLGTIAIKTELIRSCCFKALIAEYCNIVCSDCLFVGIEIYRKVKLGYIHVLAFMCRNDMLSSTRNST